MTLIACIHPEDNPTFIADRVISSELGRNSFSLPTIGHRHTKIISEFNSRLHGTMVKLLRVTDTILVLFAGDVSAAQKITRGIKSVFNGADAPLKFVRAYVEANYKTELETVSLIVHVYDKSGGDTWWKRCYDINVPGLGRVIIAGTGTERALHYLEAMPNFESIDSNPEYSRSTVCALALSGSLLGDEMRTGGPLQKGFGGYYDIVSSNQFSVNDVINITYVFWMGRREIDGNLNFNFPYKVLRKFKWSSGWGVHAVELPSPPIIENYKWEILLETSDDPGIKSELPSFPRLPDLNTNWQVNCMMLDTSRGISARLLVNYNGDRKGHMVRFLRRRKSLGFEIDAERLKDWLRPEPNQ